MAFNFVRRKYLENLKIMEKIKGNLEDQPRLQRLREVVENYRKKVESFGLYLMGEVARSRVAPPDYDFLHSKCVKIEEKREGGGINIDEEEGGIKIEKEEGEKKIEEEGGKMSEERVGKKNEEEEGKENEEERKKSEEKRKRGRPRKRRVYPWLNNHGGKKEKL
uniref:Uncharacterized protein n=1 Tax=Strongyloides venezuelensis TaxID=75913 RepID=A0A0K0FVX1_STRVS